MADKRATEPGCLYICGTPIGNMEDITLRALKVLEEVDYIAAEDTRQTLKLLNHYNISKPLISCHEHNEKQRSFEIVSMLKEGRSVALVSDAGMPAISDPGSTVINAAHEAGIKVSVVPGPTAESAALALSGYGGGRYVFEGFLPRKKKDRQQRLKEIGHEQRAIVIYEAPHRLLTTLDDLLDFLGDRHMAAVRELTKMHEEIVRGTISEVKEHFYQNEPRGEFVLVIKGDEVRQETINDGPSIEEQIAAYIAQGMSRKDAVKQVSLDTGISRNEVYKKSLF